jgi:hypothetical protein
MKTQENPQNQNQRAGSQKRKLPLCLVLAVMLLAATSAQATIMINASEVGSDVVLTLSGSVDLNSVPASYGSQGPNNSNLLIANTGQLFFGTPGANNGLFYSLQNFFGPSNFGTGGPFIQTATNTGSIFNFYASNAVFLLDATYISGASLANTMTFPGTFASLGMTPGTYEWTWSNGDFSDNLILNVGQSVPETKDQCKRGGWQSLFRPDGTPFRNQGDCIGYVITGE